MKKNVLLFTLLLSLPAASIGWALPVVDLQEWGFNVNGVVYDNLNGDAVADLPAFFNTSAFDFNTGLGTVTATLDTPGTYAIAAFFDHEMNQTVNGFDNELGQQVGTRAPGQSFQMETPGDLYTWFAAFNATTPLENAVEFGPAQDGSGSPIQDPVDQAMALGHIFDVVAGQTMVLSFVVGPNAPATGMYLQQFDPGFAGSGLPGDPSADAGSIFFSSDLSPQGTPPTAPVPEPGTMLYFLTGLLSAGASRLLRRMTS